MTPQQARRLGHLLRHSLLTMPVVLPPAPPKFSCFMCGNETYSKSCVCGACKDGRPTASGQGLTR